MLENCIFYIFKTYEFSHSQDPQATCQSPLTDVSFSGIRDYCIDYLAKKRSMLEGVALCLQCVGEIFGGRGCL